MSVVFAGVRAAWSFLLPAWRRAWLSLGVASVMVGLALGERAAPWAALAGLAILSAAAILLPLALGDAERPSLMARAAGILRLFAVAFLSFLFLFVLFLLAFVLILCFAYAAAASGHGFVASEIATWAPAVDDRGRIVVTAVALVCAVGMSWAALRIFLAAPATLAEGKVQVLAAWPLTRGEVGRLAVSLAAVSGAPAILCISLAAVRHDRGSGILSLAMSEGLVFGGLWLPLILGLMGSVYRTLSLRSSNSPVSTLTPIATAPL